MRLPALLVIVLLLIFVGLSVYICRAVARRCRSRVAPKVAKGVSAAVGLGLLYIIFMPKRSGDDEQLISLMWCIFACMTVLVPALMFVVFDLAGRIPELFKRKRIKVLSRIGVGVAFVSFAALWWGALYTARHTQVKEVEIEIANLPEAFDGYRIAQISDFHTGTYGRDTAFVARVVDELNALDPDVICFTGDIVNRQSSELEPFTGALSRLKARDGVYSVLGNHDYGDYLDWPSAEAKAKNLQDLKDMQGAMGWKMLNNATDTLIAGQDSIMLIGVENVGDPPFHTYGDLDRAYGGELADGNVKILLSHNPAHWVEDIKDAPDKNIALTLSGHTHAMQMELFDWSPARFRYPTWGGLYEDGEGRNKLYVNIGLGEVAFPARIGATPEITLITLRRK